MRFAFSKLILVTSAYAAFLVIGVGGMDAMAAQDQTAVLSVGSGLVVLGVSFFPGH